MAQLRPKESRVLLKVLLGTFVAASIWLPATEGELTFEWGFLLLCSGVLCSIIARSKNRDTTLWFLLGVGFALLSLICVLALPRLYDRLCPYCQEGVSEKASVCPHCDRDIPEYQRHLANT